MLKLSLDEIVKATKGKLLLNNNKEVEYISTSSKDIKEKFVKQSKLNKRLISAFPNVEQKDYTRKKK